MAEYFLMLALIAAGVSLQIGLLALSTAFHKNSEKIDLVFGLMGISLFLFFLIKPVGFILEDHPPYQTNILIKRIFIALHYCLYPWFFELYTGYRKKYAAIGINALIVVSYVSMALTSTEAAQPFWLTIALFFFASILIYGLFLAHKQWKAGDRVKSGWLYFAFSIYGALYLLGLFNYHDGNYFAVILGSKFFYPINLNLVVFMIIMGIRLRANHFERIYLKKLLGQRDFRWDSMLQKMQLLIIELDKKGEIKYINPFGVQVLGYKNASELISKNWFDHCLPAREGTTRKSLYVNLMKDEEHFPYYKSAILTKDGEERMIKWTRVFIYDDAGKLKGSLGIGSDITEQEHSSLEIIRLKNELEKENLLLKGEPLPEWMEQDIIGKSQPIFYAMQKAKQVAGTNASVLLEGETGVGKELFADLVHRMSLRNGKPFIKVNCGALPAELIEDELFGHEKGAFTGAIVARKGRFELADGGTIFLDEIGELPVSLQPKLLRILQNGEFEKIGGQQTIKVDVRIISATNRDLNTEVKHGRFREDLLYRLNVFPITIPALRNRKEDIPLLIQFYTDRESKKHGKEINTISKADISRLCEYPWPGNIRELKNVIERSVISSQGSTLRLDWFYQGINNTAPANVHFSMEQIEKDHIIKVLNDCHWKINGENGAAEKLAMHPNTLRSRMKKLEIHRPVTGHF